MNTTTTEITTENGKASANARKTTSGKRRMAREPGKSAATKVAGASDSPSAAAAPARAASKIAWVIALLEREQGATLAEMVETTGWLPHTTRAALTGLKKKGHILSKGKRDDVTCYRVVKAG